MLYEIEKELAELFSEGINPETGEVSEKFDVDRFNQLSMARDKKLEGICLYIKNSLSEAEQIDKEIERLTKRRNAHRNKAKSLKQFLVDNYFGIKFETPKAKMYFNQGHDSLKVIDEAQIPSGYKEHVDTVKVNTKDLLKAVKNGENIKGVEVVKKPFVIIR